ncbi:hypothetical protein [Actinacidiphila acididurans]|uniref:hypothetical protein n=1 Tax=Actinacidiphila acididurans TaxID=2784346 RepID=UPI0027DD3A38|nr:hypothetical protein [Actinacidiphila acididurans]
MLWPKAITSRVKAGGDLEIVHSYPYRSACPSTAWGESIGKADHEIFFAGYTNYFVWLD